MDNQDQQQQCPECGKRMTISTRPYTKVAEDKASAVSVLNHPHWRCEECNFVLLDEDQSSGRA